MSSFDMRDGSLAEAVAGTESHIVSLQGHERRESERVIAYWQEKVAQHGHDMTLAALDLAEMHSPEWAHRFVISVDPHPENSALLYYGAEFARLLDLPGERAPHVPTARHLRTPGISGHAAHHHHHDHHGHDDHHDHHHHDHDGHHLHHHHDGDHYHESHSAGHAHGVVLPTLKQLPTRFSELFVRGSTHLHAEPVRMEGEIHHDDGRHELFRAAFIPVTGHENPAHRLAFGAFSSRVFTPALAA